MFCIIQHIASAKRLKMAGEDLSPKGRRVSMKNWPNQHIPSRIHWHGRTGNKRKAC